MRLLFRSDNGEYRLTKDFVGDDLIPPYAILSHTWLADTEEPTFEDLINGTGEHKLGYGKIRFCGEQARQDGLQYFWVDTCCINKANHNELSHAINSMFRWYRNARRCYVYLLDVPHSPFDANHALDLQSWDSDFWKSRWFTRGWTLQELLAPASVEFFSKEGKRLGDKNSLEQQIQEITGVPALALHGAPLSQLGVDKPFLWIDHRQTKLEEDKVYSLLGIFDVTMPLSYGEGWTNAFKRLREVIDKREKCAQDLYLTDPCHDKDRIVATKGGLLEGSYYWILDNADFQRWHNDQQSRLLWIKGDPGKGKTMLLCGIINELDKSMPKTSLLSYFFCQATDLRINNATAVLRGLIYMLVRQQPSLISHIWKKYNHAGKSLFEDANTWVALVEIFTDILHDRNLSSTYLIIDALDECIVGMPKLLDFIVQRSSISRIKWIVSSRNWPDIEERLKNAGQNLSLELNSESVSTAVSAFIRHKVLQLAQRKKYNDRIRDAVMSYLSVNANDTFLWVALVCENLEEIPRRNTLAKLSEFPPGLDPLYERMMQQVSKSDDADLCKQILALVSITFRPITLIELTSLINISEDPEDLESLGEIISDCGSFLTIRDGTIYFVHQSARDYLYTKAFDKIFPSGEGEVHNEVFLRSLRVMSKTLGRDIYGIRAPGYSIEQVKQPDPDPLAASRYSCIFWVSHLCAWNSKSSKEHCVDLRKGGAVEIFMKTKYLYWLEALSLCRAMSDGVVSIAKLEVLLQVILK